LTGFLLQQSFVAYKFYLCETVEASNAADLAVPPNPRHLDFAKVFVAEMTPVAPHLLLGLGNAEQPVLLKGEKADLFLPGLLFPEQSLENAFFLHVNLRLLFCLDEALVAEQVYLLAFERKPVDAVRDRLSLVLVLFLVVNLLLVVVVVLVFRFLLRHLCPRMVFLIV